MVFHIESRKVQKTGGSSYIISLPINWIKSHKIDKNYRGYGIGGRLIGAYLNYLKKEKIKGVHLKTLSEKSFRFFEKAGFKILYKTRRSYFKHILEKSIKYFYYGRKLT